MQPGYTLPQRAACRWLWMQHLQPVRENRWCLLQTSWMAAEEGLDNDYCKLDFADTGRGGYGSANAWQAVVLSRWQSDLSQLLQLPYAWCNRHLGLSELKLASS